MAILKLLAADLSIVVKTESSHFLIGSFGSGYPAAYYAGQFCYILNSEQDKNPDDPLWQEYLHNLEIDKKEYHSMMSIVD